MEEEEVSSVTPQAVDTLEIDGGLDGARAEVSELDEPEAAAVVREDLGEEVVELNSDEDELADVQEAEDVESDEEAVNPQRPLDTSAPPLFDIKDIFDDLVSRGNHRAGLEDLIDRLNGRKLRVADLCTGTGGAVLAIEMIAQALKKLSGAELEIEHVFSAEKEKFIRQYIMRNFSTIVFDDVEELIFDLGPTATGKMVPVPQQVDILIAGFPCVDFSGLNKHRKTISDGGKSGNAFFAICEYIDQVRPPLVILENVTRCEWSGVVKHLAKKGYDADYKFVNTRKYYLPHSRRRGYLLATPRTLVSPTVTLAWKYELTRLERPASSSVEAFIATAPASANLIVNKRTAQSNNVKWQAINKQARLDERLGPAQVLTGGPNSDPIPSLVDATVTSNAWLAAQTPRLVDVFNVHYLREAKNGVDLMFKTRMLDILQSIQFGQGSTLLGISACLTSTMTPYLTNLARPLTGRECFTVQGLPVDRLDLDGLSETRLMHMAGNAMSTTVVGSAVLAALLVGHPLLTPGEGTPSSSRSSSFARADSPAEGKHDWDDSEVEPSIGAAPPSDLLERASRSGRKCECEGTAGISTSPICVCTSCGRTVCKRCKPLRGHVYVLDPTTRLEPAEMFAEVAAQLPTRLSLRGFDLDSLEQRAGAVDQSDLNLTSALVEAVSSAVDGVELRYTSLIRGKDWVATYSAPRVRLECTFDRDQVEWRLFVLPAAELAVEDPVRIALASPVARMFTNDFTDSGALVKGRWDLHLPLSDAEAEIELGFVGEDVPSWRAILQLPDFADETRNDRIEVVIPAATDALLDDDVSGIYELRPDCGTACASLYKRVEFGGEMVEPDEPPMFLFFDPDREGPDELDSFVFARDFSRLDYGVKREAVGALDSGWRVNDKSEAERVALRVEREWVLLPGARMEPVGRARVSDLVEAGLVKATKFTEVGAQVVGLPQKRTYIKSGNPRKAKRRRVESSTESEARTVSSDESEIESEEESDDNVRPPSRSARPPQPVKRPAAPTRPSPPRKVARPIAATTDSGNSSDDEDEPDSEPVRPLPKPPVKPAVRRQMRPLRRQPASPAKSNADSESDFDAEPSTGGDSTAQDDSDDEVMVVYNASPRKTVAASRPRPRPAAPSTTPEEEKEASEGGSEGSPAPSSSTSGGAVARQLAPTARVLGKSKADAPLSSGRKKQRPVVESSGAESDGSYEDRGSGQGVVASRQPLVAERRGRSKAVEVVDLTLDSD